MPSTWEGHKRLWETPDRWGTWDIHVRVRLEACEQVRGWHVRDTREAAWAAHEKTPKGLSQAMKGGRQSPPWGHRAPRCPTAAGEVSVPGGDMLSKWDVFLQLCVLSQAIASLSSSISLFGAHEVRGSVWDKLQEDRKGEAMKKNYNQRLLVHSRLPSK